MQAEIWFLRHGQSTANSGENDCVDSPLSAVGKEQANRVVGEFDLVIVSPLCRAQETLKHSCIKFEEIHIEPLCRERIFAERDLLPGESLVIESDECYSNRIRLFKEKVLEFAQTRKKILVVGHSYFFASWREGVGMCNAELRQIKHF